MAICVCVKNLLHPALNAATLFAEDEKWDLSSLLGYVVCSGGKGTEFSGKLKGTWYSYEFVKDGTNMDGRLYYLQADNRTFYVLHFTVRVQNLLNSALRWTSSRAAFVSSDTSASLCCMIQGHRSMVALNRFSLKARSVGC